MPKKPEDQASPPAPPTVTQRRLGWKKEHADPRDKRLAALLGLPPPPPSSSTGCSAYVAKLLDQGGREGCVGWSLAQAIWTRWNMLAALANAPGPLAQPSPLWLWNMARVRTGNADQNDGTFIRDAIKQAIAVGVPPESAFPANDDSIDYLVKPSEAAARLAYDQRFPLGYYRIDDDPAKRKIQIQQAISAGYPVVFGTLVTNGFLQLMSHGPIQVPARFDDVAGGHAMAAMAYDQNGVKGPNSWQDVDKGIFWGNDGWFYFSWDYLLWEQTNDLWAIDVGLPAASYGVTA